MDKKEIIREAVGEIDLKYIENAVEPQKKEPLRLRLRRMKKGWIAAAAALLVCLVTGGVILANSDVFQVNRGEPEEDYDDNALDSVMAYNQLLTLVRNRDTITREDVLSPYACDGYYSSDYEAWYGGAYVNVHGQLVVCLAESAGKEAMEEGKAKLSSLTSLFREVPYSFGELMDVCGDLYVYCTGEESQNENFRIWNWGIDEYENVVHVGLNALDEETLQKVRAQVRLPEALTFSYEESGDVADDLPIAP